ncbi:exodeoxyribonuclease VII small subunit [Thermomonas hydrothermalis]|jgi:exodeoxyribonuclease VII small subunit|uniref:Exodeoxyribonuclease 7 small subunit n=1 Tax=Thermomonas hydrothermalis TaxID=213588 RepID=A0A1M4V8C5_9GAMM|nr:exodeoxyribonuclease VII small subunit [Thermomonas hydrothermalis]MCL6620158.1 exodeoxyribonuclease VII small subunit [Thermomonas hydrothermalis]SHE65137.1 Exodeoxyribonuclease VII small subunit [Thermomonas hydrothermalis]
MHTTPDSQDTSPVSDFERSMKELESLVSRLESGDMTLEQSLDAYARGVALYNRCKAALDEAELRVRQLSDPARPEQSSEFTSGSDD